MKRRPVVDEPHQNALPTTDRARTAMLRWLDRLPRIGLLPVAAWLAIAPVTPEPHLVEKLRMLGQGALVRQLDVFDLAMHGTPLLLVALKLWRQRRASRQ
jgi:hypothetical protein